MVPSGFRADDAEPPSRGHRLTTHALTRQSRHAYPLQLLRFVTLAAGWTRQTVSVMHASRHHHIVFAFQYVPLPPSGFAAQARLDVWVAYTSRPSRNPPIANPSKPKWLGPKAGTYFHASFRKLRILASAGLPKASSTCTGCPGALARAFGMHMVAEDYESLQRGQT